MFSESLYEYFGCGARLIYLRHAQQRLPIHGQGYVLNVIDLFLSDMERFQFTTTSVAAEGLRKFRNSKQNKPKDTLLTSQEAKELAMLADNLTPIWEAESRNMRTVVLIEKRFELGKLIGRVSALMPGGVYDQLPNVAQYDMNEAGKCIALERATAAAFHCLRATEAMLKKMYFCFIKRKRLRNPMWHGMVEALENKKRNKPSKILLDHLDMIRKNYRNPTQHPEMIYNIEEAQNLFSNCISAIHMMSQSINEKKCK